MCTPVVEIFTFVFQINSYQLVIFIGFEMAAPKFHCDLLSLEALQSVAESLTKQKIENAMASKLALAGAGPHPAMMMDDVLLHIASFLEPKDLKSCRFVCLDWARVMGRELAGHVIKMIALVTPKTKYEFLGERQGHSKYSLAATQEYISFLNGRNKYIGMKIRRYEVFDVGYEAARKDFFEKPEIVENITVLKVVSLDLGSFLSYITKLKLLKELSVFDSTAEEKLQTDTQMLEGAPDLSKKAEIQNVSQIEKLLISTCALQRSNKILKMILPMCPKLKVLDITEVHTKSSCFCLRIIRKFSVTAGLKTLRMHQTKPERYNKPGVPWDNRGLGTTRSMNDDVWPPTEVGVGVTIGKSIRQFVKNPIAQNLQHFHVHPWHFVPTWEWRKIFNAAKANKMQLRSLDLAVLVSAHLYDDCELSSWQNPRSSSVILSPSVKNPEPMDYMSFFPKNPDNTTMVTVKSLILDLFYNLTTQFAGGPELKYTAVKPFNLTTTRILPSVTRLSLHLCPWADVSSNFASAFPNLKILTIHKEELFRFNNLLKNSPPTLEELYLLKGDKITENPKLEFFCVFDDLFIKGNAIMSVPKLRKLVIGVCACNLSDDLVFKGLLKLPELSELYIESATKFTKRAKSALKKKLTVLECE